MATALEILANLIPKFRFVLDQKYTHTHPDVSSDIVPVSTRVASENPMAIEVKKRT